MRSQCVAHHLLVKRSRSHGSFEVFVMSAPWLPLYMTESLHMWHTYITWGMICHAPFPGAKVKVTWVVWSFGPVCSVAWSLFGQITSYVAYIKHKGQCVAPHFQDQKSRSHGSFKVLALSAPWIRLYLAESLHLWQAYNTWGDNVLCTIFKMIVQRSRSHRSFKVFTLSTPWLPPYLTKSLHMWHTYNAQGGNVLRTIFRTKGQRSRSHGSFKVLTLSAPWLRPHLIESLHHMWHNTIHAGWCVAHHFQDERSKVNVMSHSKFLPCPLCGFLLIAWWNGSNMLLFGG